MQNLKEKRQHINEIEQKFKNQFSGSKIDKLETSQPQIFTNIQ